MDYLQNEKIQKPLSSLKLKGKRERGFQSSPNSILKNLLWYGEGKGQVLTMLKQCATLKEEAGVLECVYEANDELNYDIPVYSKKIVQTKYVHDNTPFLFE